MRAVAYARFSSDRQCDHSIEDQFELCRRYVAKQQWQLVQVYVDRALSGASAARPGYQALLADAEGASTMSSWSSAWTESGAGSPMSQPCTTAWSFAASHCTPSTWAWSPRCTLACSAPWHSSISRTSRTRRGAASSGGCCRAKPPAGGPTATARSRARPGSVGSTRPRPRWCDASSSSSRLEQVHGRLHAGSTPKMCRDREDEPAGHDDPRSSRARHRDPEQRALCRAAGLESL